VHDVEAFFEGTTA